MCWTTTREVLLARIRQKGDRPGSAEGTL